MPLDPETKAILDALAEGQRAIAAGIASLATRSAEPPKAVEPPKDENAELKARVAKLETERNNRDQVIANLVDEPSRRGFVVKDDKGEIRTLNPQDTGPFVRELLSRCEQDDISPAFRQVVKNAQVQVGTRQVSVFDLRHKTRGQLPGTEGEAYRQACEDAPTLLRSILNAAAADGTFRSWMRTEALT